VHTRQRHMTHCLVNHNITDHLVFVIGSAGSVMMCCVIGNFASCKICAVIHFLHAKNFSATEVHRELCTVYGQNVMNEGTATRWCRMFKDGLVVNKCSR
jgi:hypothetical protein